MAFVREAVLYFTKKWNKDLIFRYFNELGMKVAIYNLIMTVEKNLIFKSYKYQVHRIYAQLYKTENTSLKTDTA